MKNGLLMEKDFSLTQEDLVYVWILDNHQIEFDFVNQQIELLHHTSQDVFHQEFHFDTLKRKV